LSNAEPPTGKDERMSAEQNPDLTAVPWRAGRKNPRNMYAVTGNDWEAHPDIGKLDTAELAAEACAAHNEALARRGGQAGAGGRP